MRRGEWEEGNGKRGMGRGEWEEREWEERDREERDRELSRSILSEIWLSSLEDLEMVLDVAVDHAEQKRKIDLMACGRTTARPSLRG
jgi:hypothetical protein